MIFTLWFLECSFHIGVCDFHIGVCDFHIGVCDFHIGVCDFHIGVCDFHIVVSGMWFSHPVRIRFVSRNTPWMVHHCARDG